MDADQIVRTDMAELYDMDIDGKPLAYTPFCDNNKEMDGFRFWNQVIACSAQISSNLLQPLFVDFLIYYSRAQFVHEQIIPLRTNHKMIYFLSEVNTICCSVLLRICPLALYVYIRYKVPFNKSF